MKKFTKLFLSSALVAAMAMSSLVAFADEIPTEFEITGDVTGTYYAADKTVGEDTIKAGTVDITAIDGLPEEYADQATFLVVKGALTNSITQSDVKGIDQAAGAAFDKTGLLGTPDAENLGQDVHSQLYTVAVGYYASAGNFVVKTGTFTINDGSAPKYLIGDANGSESVTIADASAIASHLADKNVITDEVKLLAADANLSGGVTIADASLIATYLADKAGVDCKVNTWSN